MQNIQYSVQGDVQGNCSFPGLGNQLGSLPVPAFQRQVASNCDVQYYFNGQPGISGCNAGMSTGDFTTSSSWSSAGGCPENYASFECGIDPASANAVGFFGEGRETRSVSKVTDNMSFILDRPELTPHEEGGNTGYNMMCAVGRADSITATVVEPLDGALTFRRSEVKIKPFSQENRSVMLSRTSVPDIGKVGGGFPCPISGCSRKKAYSSSQKWYNHLINVHGDGFRLFNSRMGSIDALGERVLAWQGSIQCRILGCERTTGFSSLHRLGVHLLQYHQDVVDNQPYNISWKPATYINYYGERPLSCLKTGSGVGKRYQTRHGLGFYCYEHPHVVLPQNPEALGKHWQTEHNRQLLQCPLQVCTDRQIFEHTGRLYDHVRRQHQDTP